MILGISVGVTTALCISWHAYSLRQTSEMSTAILSFFKSFAALSTVTLLITFTSFGKWELPTDLTFWSLIITVILFETIITYTFTRAHQKGDQSLVGPLFAISPIFLLPIGILFLGDTFTIYGIIGVCIVFTGGIISTWIQGERTLIGSLRVIKYDKGAPWMILAAIFAAMVVAVAKFSFNEGISVLTFGFFVFLGQTFLILPFALTVHIKHNKINAPRWCVVVASMSFGVLQILHYTGISLLPAAYFISIKRLSIISDVFVGRIFGNEKQWFGSRLTGATIMLTGVILFLLLGN